MKEDRWRTDGGGGENHVDQESRTGLYRRSEVKTDTNKAADNHKIGNPQFKVGLRHRKIMGPEAHASREKSKGRGGLEDGGKARGKRGS